MEFDDMVAALVKLGLIEVEEIEEIEIEE